MRYAPATVFALLLVSLAQAGPLLGVGEVRSIQQSGPQQLRVATSAGQLELTVYAPEVVRIRMDKKALGRDFSYAVTAAAAPTRTVFRDGATEALLSTDAITVRIAKHPFALTFLTPDGKVINQDEPGLTTSWIGDEVTTYKTLQDGERFIGLGEKTGNLDRRGQAYTNWNTDAYRYGAWTDPLYSSIPFFIGAHHGLAYGIFFDNSFRSDFNFGASNKRFASFGAQGGEMNYYFIHAPSVAGIVRAYTGLTGRMPLPPLWSLGYQQNRYSYYPEAEVMRIARTLREKQIPADGITLDIHYMDGYRLFSWDGQRFPDPAGMTARLAAMGFKTTVIVDPGIKAEKGYGAYERGMQDKIFVTYPDGSNYTAEVWPGWCNFPDFTSSKGRAWWQKEVRFFAQSGVAGLWNDMNEISTWGQHMPNNILFDFDGAQATHQQARNVYALNMVRASYEGMKAATGQRPFMLSRSGFAGMQRYGAIWTGDNTATEEHMLLGVRLLNSMGLSGMAFTGMDIGGFLGEPSQSLYARWMQVGAFTPYFRNHAAIDSRASEPWTYGDDVLDLSRRAINLRYRLMPYLYSAFHDAAETGEPVMRSLAIDYTHEAKVYEPRYQNQFQFGRAFLVAPFESTREMGKAWLPPGQWYDLASDTPEQGGQEKTLELSLEHLPVWVRAGSIVPVQSLVQSTAEKPDGTLALHIWKGNAHVAGSYYEDDGASFAYQDGAYYQRVLDYDGAARRITLGAVQGKYKSKFNKLELVLHGFGAAPALTVNGKAVSVAAGEVDLAGKVKVARAVIDNDGGTIAIAY